MKRRTFLSRASTVLAGCTTFAAVAAEPVRMGALITLSGPAGLFGASCKACAELAVEQINKQGGLLGRKVELLVGDAGATPSEVAQTALRLWRGNRVQAFIGMHDSAVRAAVQGVFRGEVPYIFTPTYEGGECSRNMFIVGETPAQQLQPVIPWLLAHRKVKRWFIVGNDYIYPRNVGAAAKRFIQTAGGSVVGEEYVPFTVDNFDSVLGRIKASGADCVLMPLVGGSCVNFNKAFATFGLSDQIVRLGTVLEENTLLGIGEQGARNLYSTAAYFTCLETPAAKAFSDAYHQRFAASAAPLLNGLAESVYQGFLLAAALTKAAGAISVNDWSRVAEGLQYESPRGRVTMESRHLVQSIYLAQASGTNFKIAATFDRVSPQQSCKD